MRNLFFGAAVACLLAASGVQAQDPAPGSLGAQVAAARDPGAGAPVQYEIAFDNAAHHEAQVTATWRGVPAGPLKLQMSRSSPGRYAIHEFAKNVYRVTAVDGAGRALKIDRTDPYGWTVAGHDGVVKVTYTLYADRGDGTYSQVDATHAHLNMPATFLWASGFDDKPIRVSFKRADPAWKIATQLPPAAGLADTFWAPNLQYFMDSPTELSDFDLREWQVADGGRTYTFRLALHHNGTEADADQFAEKLKKIVPEHIKVFGQAPRFDFGTYTFIADYLPQITGDGMEHRNSTIISNASSLFRANFAQLGTASHELFHAWNVERIRPAELEPFDFTRANPTPSLWLAEGFTQYYGPLLIRRSGQSTVDAYLADLSRTLNGVVNGPGRQYGSPQEMSLRAPFVDAAAALDPTNPNIFTSYYPYGAVIGLALDLELRGRPRTATLDDYMKRLWRTHGVSETPYRPQDLQAALAEVSGDARFAERFFAASIQGSALPDFEPLFARAGLKLRPKSPKKAWLGAQRVRVSGSEVILDEAPAPGSALYAAGVERGDRILGIGRFEFAADADWQDALERLKPDETAKVRFIQRGQTREADLKVAADSTLEVVRFENAGLKPSRAQLAFRDRWLGPATPAP
ncbi:M61 family metallopeptidase [Phenylobacterium deserti]|uniref:M61 family peptidase n=1 Tax=Phenylobacterium deserti TaxID=1914756 RepID=A0A328AST0_9CAUL|nr:M61 family metallopeptidase [Phenylobacterium deserti]RAK58050.1 M61 family peptidase [Phenylobacterium deserti]